jgi:hypothetical protein
MSERGKVATQVFISFSHDSSGHRQRPRLRGLEDEAKLAYRTAYTKPLMDQFFAWLGQTLYARILIAFSTNVAH